MSETIKCPICGKEVIPEVLAGKKFCPECENEIISPAPSPAEKPAEKPAGKPAERQSGAPEAPQQAGASIKDGMGIIENSRNKVGAVESFSDNSVTNNTTNTTTNNISNITNINDDTKKSVICEISGKQILVTSSVKCPVCGKVVSNQYYNESKLRCQACEKECIAEYQAFYRDLTKGSRVIDKQMREVLDNKAASLKLDAADIKEIELKLRKEGGGKDAYLSEIKQRDFVRTIDQFLQAGMSLTTCLGKVEAYAKVTEDEQVQCWYHLLWAVARPVEYRKALSEAVVDSFWQTYWDFAAAVRLGKSAEAVNAVDTLKEKFPEHVNDGLFAQVLLEQCQFFMTKNEDYLKDAQQDMQGLSMFESESLAAVQAVQIAISMFIVAGQIVKFEETPEQEAQRPQAAAQSQGGQARPQTTGTQARPQTTATQARPQAAGGQARPQATAQRPQAASQKGVVLNNTAGGPLNPEVSFATATNSGKGGTKGKGGLWATLVIVALLIGGGAYFFLAKDNTTPKETPTASTPAPESKAAPSKTTTDSKSEENKEPVTQTASQAEPAAPKTMAEKAAAKTAAQKAAEKASAQAPSSSAAMSEGMKKAMQAYSAGDYKAAHDLFKQEGNAGNAEACYQLGLMLSTGKGSVAKNTLQAKVWLKKAVSLGHPDAQAALSNL